MLNPLNFLKLKNKLKIAKKFLLGVFLLLSISNSLAAINIKELSTWDNFSIKIYCGLNDFLGIRKEKCDTNIYNIDKINEEIFKENLVSQISIDRKSVV